MAGPPINRSAPRSAAPIPATPAGALNKRIPRDVLGIPGAHYQLWVHNVRKGEDPRSEFQNQPDRYRVIFTLSRHALDKQSLDFKGEGDSFIQIAKPQNERKEEDPESVLIFSKYASPTGIEKIEISGIPNKDGRLAQCTVELSAPSFTEADRAAFGAVSAFFSMVAFEIDVPVRLGQLNLEQVSTQNASMTYTCPYPDVHLTAAGADLNTSPYIHALLSLYREGINSSSMNYQFLCWYKVVEGINWKRTDELSKQSVAEKAKFKLAVPEVVPGTVEATRQLVSSVFPLIGEQGVKDERWDHVVPKDVLGWKFNRIREEKLENVRNKIAHMLTERGGDLSLSPDTHSHRAEVTRWITLLRLMARVMIRNEKLRHPLPVPTFTIPTEGGHISEIREQFRKS